ncbi:hypothetical protein TB2_007534 [Malus domestica]
MVLLCNFKCPFDWVVPVEKSFRIHNGYKTVVPRNGSITSKSPKSFLSVGVEDVDEEVDFEGLCFGLLELTGDFKSTPASASDGHAELYRLMGDSLPALFTLAEEVPSIAPFF